MIEIAFYFFAFISTVAGSFLFMRYSGRLASLDIPNERSSHERPTIRGGGIVIVTVCCILYLLGAPVFVYSINWGFLSGGLLVAVVSWADDHFDVPAGIRFLAHSASAILLIYFCGPMAAIGIEGPGNVLAFSWLAPAVTFLWVVWMINAYNFMDGIDGIAGIQGVVAGIGWVGLGFLIGSDPMKLFAGVLLMSCVGFLLFNWTPARIFMGDVGSAFLGFSFAAMPLIGNGAASNADPILFLAAVGFLWLFLFDTLFTFARRLLRGEKVWTAHRSHLYQNLTQRWKSHSKVTLLYGSLGLIIASVILFSAGSSAGGFWWICGSMFGGALIVTALGFQKGN